MMMEYGPLVEVLRRLVAVLMMLANALAGVAAPAEHPADQCREDEAWVAVDYRDPAGIEDVHGVTRRCIPVDDL